MFSGLGEDELADMLERADLAIAIPELRAAMLDQFAQVLRQITELAAERTGRAPADFAVRTLAGAIVGVMISAEFYWVEHPDSDSFALLDDALAQLESRLPY